MYAKILLGVMCTIAVLTLTIGIQDAVTKTNNEDKGSDKMEFPANKTEKEWKEELTEQQYEILRNKGTERPWTGKFNDHFEEGSYTCAGCGNVLFDSETKFDSHCGWPSFYDALDKSKVKEIQDNSHGMSRTEVVCANCGGHLGHVFNDGPNPTGLRYCINSASLDFESDSSNGKKQD
jgi:peptide-methionine (R)-S-oxide reductase